MITKYTEDKLLEACLGSGSQAIWLRQRMRVVYVCLLTNTEIGMDNEYERLADQEWKAATEPLPDTAQAELKARTTYLHVLCRRAKLGRNGIGPAKGLTRTHHSGRLVTFSWDIRPDTAAKLIGGSIYMHHKKSDAAYMCGLIEDFFVDPTRGGRVVFVFRAQLMTHHQHWRGKMHRRARFAYTIGET